MRLNYAARAMAERAHREHLVLTPDEQRLTGMRNRVARPGSAYYRPWYIITDGMAKDAT